jgi:hypothetical protein
MNKRIGFLGLLGITIGFLIPASVSAQQPYCYREGFNHPVVYHDGYWREREWREARERQILREREWRDHQRQIRCAGLR